jgi:hypothetical protein
MANPVKDGEETDRGWHNSALGPLFLDILGLQHRTHALSRPQIGFAGFLKHRRNLTTDCLTGPLAVVLLLRHDRAPSLPPRQVITINTNSMFHLLSWDAASIAGPATF